MHINIRQNTEEKNLKKYVRCGSLALLAHKIHASKIVQNTLFYLVEWESYPEPEFYTWEPGQCFSLSENLILASSVKLPLSQKRSQKIKGFEEILNLNEKKDKFCFILKSSPHCFKNYLIVSFAKINLNDNVFNKLKKNIIKFISQQIVEGQFPKSLHLKKCLINIPSLNVQNLKLTSYLYGIGEAGTDILTQPFEITMKNQPMKNAQKQRQNCENEAKPTKKIKSEQKVASHLIKNNQVLYKVESPFKDYQFRISSYENLKKYNYQINYPQEIASYLQNFIIKQMRNS